MKIKLLFKAIEILLIRIAGITVLAILGTLAFFEWPAVTTIALTTALILSAGSFFTYLIYIELENKQVRPIMVELRRSPRKTKKQNI